MPAAGARRSTRVFMPKVPKPPPQDLVDPATRVLRSGKRLAADRIGWDDKDAVTCHVEDIDQDRIHQNQQLLQSQQQHEKETAPRPELPPVNKDFTFVYSRKRRQQRPPTKLLPQKGRFGIVYTRRRLTRPKLDPIQQEMDLGSPSGLATAISCSSSQEFMSRTDFLDAHFSAMVEHVAPHSRAVTLVILVDTSSIRSSHRLIGLLLPVLRWMRSSGQQGKVRSIASFVSSLGISNVFASQGLHFVKLHRHRASALLHRTLVHCGWCVLHGANKSGPLLSVNFSALPYYFQRLHSAVAFSSMYLPAAIRESMLMIGTPEQMHHQISLDVNSGSQCTGVAKSTAYPGSDEPFRVPQDYMPLEQVAGVLVHGMKLKKHQRKRSKMRHPRIRRRPTTRLSNSAIGRKQTMLLTQPKVKLPSSRQAPVETAQPKVALEISLDLLENLDDSDVSTPGSTRKQKRSSLKSPVERMNEKLDLAEVRQNIECIQCKANILIIRDDRCWREEGAEIMLELSDTNEWRIVVKIQGVTRYSLKPSDPRLNSSNRYTHASIWAMDDAWKLEFSDKRDWLLFRELHVQGRERNAQGKTIPIPGVYDVSDDMEGVVTNAFSRPVSYYIRMVDDEIGRALSNDSIYDMDSEDERWIVELNSAHSDQNNSQQKHISYEDFEKIITIFEKDAYSNPERQHDIDELLSRNPSLGKDDTVLAVYEYWRNKRSKRAAPLLRIFQGVPLRRGLLSQKSPVKRKRTFKRQRIQVGRGKPEALLQDNAEEEVALQRVAQAEAARDQAAEKAVRLRNRAQSLMKNADLATYKSVMALRIAEAAKASDSSRDLVSAVLD